MKPTSCLINCWLNTVALCWTKILSWLELEPTSTTWCSNEPSHMLHPTTLDDVGPASRLRFDWPESMIDNLNIGDNFIHVINNFERFVIRWIILFTHRTIGPWWLTVALNNNVEMINAKFLKL